MRFRQDWTSIAALCAFCAAGVVGWSASPSSFYIVSVGFSDAGPGWHRSVLEVTPDGSDVIVRYIRAMPVSVNCGEGAKILTTATRLPDTSLGEISSGLDLCAIDPTELRRTIRAFLQSKPGAVYAGDHFTIVARCGKENKVISLPGDWTVDMGRLKWAQPRIAPLWTLEETIGKRAFGHFASIDVVPPELAAQLKSADEPILSELKSGKFDAGLAPESFRDDVAMFRPESEGSGFTVKLTNAGQFRFDHYVDPKYPPLAKQARVHDAVELEISFNPITGETEQVTVLSGHPMLVPATKETAQHWRFIPGSDPALHTTRITVEFVFRCP